MLLYSFNSKSLNVKTFICQVYDFCVKCYWWCLQIWISIGEGRTSKLQVWMSFSIKLQMPANEHHSMQKNINLTTQLTKGLTGD